MINLFFGISFLCISFMFFILAQSKTNTQKLIKSNGHEFAFKANKILKICSFFLFLLSIVILYYEL